MRDREGRVDGMDFKNEVSLLNSVKKPIGTKIVATPGSLVLTQHRMDVVVETMIEANVGEFDSFVQFKELFNVSKKIKKDDDVFVSMNSDGNIVITINDEDNIISSVEDVVLSAMADSMKAKKALEEKIKLAEKFGLRLSKKDKNKWSELKYLDDKEVDDKMFEDIATFDSDRFIDMITSAQPFTGSDDLRPALGAILIESGSKNTNIVATDAHRMIIAKVPVKSSSKKDFMITGAAGDSLVRIAKKKDLSDEIVISKFKNRYKVSTGSRCVTYVDDVRATYPNWRGVLPVSHTRKVVVEADAFMEALKGAASLVDKTTHGVGIMIKDDGVDVLLNEHTRGSGEYLSSVPGKVDGGGILIGFNIRFLMDAVRPFSGMKITIKGTQQNRAITIESSKHSIGAKTLIMPVMLR